MSASVEPIIAFAEGRLVPVLSTGVGVVAGLLLEHDVPQLLCAVGLHPRLEGHGRRQVERGCVGHRDEVVRAVEAERLAELAGVDQVAPESVPVWAPPELSASGRPGAFVEAVGRDRPARAACIGHGDVDGRTSVVLPAPSRAIAVSVCGPFEAAVVSHATEYGFVVSSVPKFVPSSRNCTPATAVLSAADAVTFTVCDTVAPLAGAVSETVGGVVSAVTVADAWFEAGRDVPRGIFGGHLVEVGACGRRRVREARAGRLSRLGSRRRA